MSLNSYITQRANVTLKWDLHNEDEILWIIQLVNLCFLSGSIALFGIFTNLINLVVFYYQGLNTTSNISFFMLAVSDLSCLICHEVYVIFSLPVFKSTGLLVIYVDMQYVFSAIPREGFARYSCLITAVITTERWLCIVYPQTVREIITSSRLTVVLVCVGVVNIMSGLPTYFTCLLGWVFYPTANITLFSIVVTNITHAQEKDVVIVHAIFLMLTVTSVVGSTIVLVVKLNQASSWRNSANVNQKYALSKRETTAKSMVVLIACILIACYAPAVLLSITTFCEPEFALKGNYVQLYLTAWSFALLFETINSSVNIIIYLNMSTKYRRTLKTLLKMAIFK